MSDNIAEMADPQQWPAIRSQLRKLQRMTVALQKIITIDEGKTVLTMIARNALDGRDD